MTLNEKLMHEEKAGEEPLTTDKTGWVYTKNDWGVDLASLTVRHRRGNDPNRQEETTYHNVPAGGTVGPLEIDYTIGIGSPFDYWWIKFVENTGTTYTIKNNFFCYISSSDNGRVDLRIDGSDRELYVAFSKSSGCSVAIYVVDEDSEE